jgi:hypothetical protein
VWPGICAPPIVLALMPSCRQSIRDASWPGCVERSIARTPLKRPKYWRKPGSTCSAVRPGSRTHIPSPSGLGPGSGADKVRVVRWSLNDLDRAMTEQGLHGFIKVIHRPDGEVLGAQIVAARAGEIIHELALAIDKGIKLDDLASRIHVYPSYAAAGVQQLAAEVRLESLSRGRIAKMARGPARLLRS